MKNLILIKISIDSFNLKDTYNCPFINKILLT